MTSRHGFGGAPLGNLFNEVSPESAEATLDAAWMRGIRYFDTAPLYGLGLSERRVGDFLRSRTSDEYVLSTKVGRLLSSPAATPTDKNREWRGGLDFQTRFDYSYDGIIRSHEDSLQRLGLPRIDLLIVHDLDLMHHHSSDLFEKHLTDLFASGGRALQELRDSGQISGIGAGINETGLIPRLLDRVDIDFVLVAMRYTLLDQSIAPELDECARRDIGVVVGAVFNSGILATGAVPGAKYNYSSPPPEIVVRVREIETVCRAFGVSITAAALQFPLGNPCVASVIPGARSPGEIHTNADLLKEPIALEFWDELRRRGLIPE